MSAIWRERLAKILPWGIYLVIFLLPWQTRYIFGDIPLAGRFSGWGILSVYATEILVAFLLIGHFLFRGTTHWRSKKIGNLGLLIVLFLLLLANSAATAYLPALAWNHLVYAVSALAFGYLILNGGVSVDRLRTAFSTSLIGPAILGWWQVLASFSGASKWLGLAVRNAQTAGDSVWWFDGIRHLRAYGSFSHPNIFSGYLVVAILWLWFGGTRKLSENILLGFLAVTLILTFSQGAWLGLVIGMVVGYTAKIWPQIWRKFGSIGTGMVLGASIIFALAAPFIFHPTVATYSERLTQLHDWTEVAQPTLFGEGANNYPYSWQAAISAHDWWLYQPIHFLPFLLYAEIGIFGCLILLIILYKIDQINYRLLPNKTALFGLTAGAALMTISFFDHYLWTQWSGLVLVVIVLTLSTMDDKFQD